MNRHAHLPGIPGCLILTLMIAQIAEAQGYLGTAGSAGIDYGYYQASQPGPGPAGPAPAPAPASSASSGSSSSSSSRSSSTRLASVPNMFGDTYFPGRSAEIFGIGSDNFIDGIPSVSGGRTVIGENNKVIPMDRLWFSYNHFHNAFRAASITGGGVINEQLHVERFMIGLEKTFTMFDSDFSWEIRLPAFNELDYAADGFEIEGGGFGNLGVIIKSLLWEGDTCAIGGGFGIGVPTGDNVTGAIDGTSFVVHNDTVFLQPFIGAVGQPNDLLFYHAMVQLDIAMNQNRYDFGGVTYGQRPEQNFARYDLAGGVWLYRDNYAPFLTGLAFVVEGHYMHSITDGKEINDPGFNVFFGEDGSNFDFFNLTFGVHTELYNNITARVGGVVPLKDLPHRQFDFEVLFSLNAYFGG